MIFTKQLKDMKPTDRPIHCSDKKRLKFYVKDDNKCDIFVHIFQHLKLFSNNVNLRFDEDKLYVQGMDGSHVSVFELNITSSWFDEYNIEQNKDAIIFSIFEMYFWYLQFLPKYEQKQVA